MKTNDNVTMSKDSQQLARNILLEYFTVDKVDKLVSNFGTDKFFDELQEYTKDNKKVYEELKERFIHICGDLLHMVHIVEKNDNADSILKRIYSNKYDVEYCDEYDFTHNEYTVMSNVRYALKKLDMTQAELSRRTGIPKNTLNNILKDPSRTSFMNVVKIAYVLDMSIHKLFYIQEIDKDK